jgi:hypothetical protein
MEIEQQKDAALWRIAKRRAAFKLSVATYVVVNCLLLAIWYFTSGTGSYFWPVWPILGWGLGIAVQYFGAYHSDSIFSAEKEYGKLKINNN